MFFFWVSRMTECIFSGSHYHIHIFMVVLQQCFGLFRIPRSSRAFCIFCSNGWWSFGWISAMSQAQIMRDLSVTWATRTLTSRWPGEVKKPVWSREIHFNLLDFGYGISASYWNPSNLASNLNHRKIWFVAHWSFTCLLHFGFVCWKQRTVHGSFML